MRKGPTWLGHWRPKAVIDVPAPVLPPRHRMLRSSSRARPHSRPSRTLFAYSIPSIACIPVDFCRTRRDGIMHRARKAPGGGRARLQVGEQLVEILLHPLDAGHVHLRMTLEQLGPCQCGQRCDRTSPDIVTPEAHRVWTAPVPTYTRGAPRSVQRWTAIRSMGPEVSCGVRHSAAQERSGAVCAMRRGAQCRRWEPPPRHRAARCLPSCLSSGVRCAARARRRHPDERCAQAMHATRQTRQTPVTRHTPLTR